MSSPFRSNPFHARLILLLVRILCHSARMRKDPLHALFSDVASNRRGKRNLLGILDICGESRDVLRFDDASNRSFDQNLSDSLDSDAGSWRRR